MKYPIGVQSFDKLREENYVYVDKTDLIYQLAQQSICFLCRPRRFGKSLTLSTLRCYFEGKKHLFEGLKIMQLEQEWKEYPVFHIDFNGVDFSADSALECKLEGYLGEWEKKYGKSEFKTLTGDRFAYILQQAHEQTGRRVVVLIDEYDKPLLDTMGTSHEEKNRNILKAFYSVFKLADQHLRFVLLTGVTKFSQVSIFSGFNQPKDISLDEKYETLCGISEDELYNSFYESIVQFAAKRQCTVDQMKLLLKNKYDGYHFSTAMTDVYNPFSIINALDSMALSDYWFSTGTPTYLIKLMSRYNQNMDDLLQKWYSQEEFIDYRADVDAPVPMLYQSGYLTIKEYDSETESFLLDYPNQEVKAGMLTMLIDDYMRSDNNDFASSLVRDFNIMLRRAQLDKLRDRLTSFFAAQNYVMKKDMELLLSGKIQNSINYLPGAK